MPAESNSWQAPLLLPVVSDSIMGSFFHLLPSWRVLRTLSLCCSRAGIYKHEKRCGEDWGQNQSFDYVKVGFTGEWEIVGGVWGQRWSWSLARNMSLAWMPNPKTSLSPCWALSYGPHRPSPPASGPQQGGTLRVLMILQTASRPPLRVALTSHPGSSHATESWDWDLVW